MAWTNSPSRRTAAERRALTTMTITPSEKQVEVGFRNGVPVVVGGQNGGVYRTPATSTR